MATYTNTTGIFTNVAAATCSVTVKNAAGCISAPNVTINTQPATPAAQLRLQLCNQRVP
jgi:hypothetical protein